MEEWVKSWNGVILVCLIGLVFYVYYVVYLRSEKKREMLRRQGIRGPPPSFFYGNMAEMKRSYPAVGAAQDQHGGRVSHNYISNIFPYFERWRKEYGSVFQYCTGSLQMLYVSEPEMVKEMNLCKSFEFGKPFYMQRDRRAMFGEGVIASNGSIWANQRKIIASEFFIGKVKGMLDLMMESSLDLVKLWEKKIEASEGEITEITVDGDLRNFSADIISRACFGSSYLKGKDIFKKIRLLQHSMSVHVGLPGFRYLPTKSNRKIWRLEKEIRSLILKVVKEQEEERARRGDDQERDLLQRILEEARSGHGGEEMANNYVVDNCKNIYFAGHETTATAASWILMLLALNPEWQIRARQEVVELCASTNTIPDTTMLPKMKTVTMVIHESMRLYPPAAFVSREAHKDMEFGGVSIPKGVNVWVSVATLHHDPSIWGPDALEFRPERFARGISNACKHPHAYIPFGLGIRTCLGQNFAMVELKVFLSFVLPRFSFSLSPNYRHSPTYKMFLEPEHGVTLLMKRL